MATQMTIAVEDVDGAIRQVVADQRDSIAFERAERIGVNTAWEIMPTALFYCLAYYSEKRQGLTTLTRDEWESQVIHVEIVTTDRVDPTKTAAQPSSPSPSPSKPASRSPRSRPGQAKNS